jgi:hypothetical protein
MDPRPVLYLDIDDTLLTYRHGWPEAAPGAHEFLLWALEHFEIRWLTRWCPGGEMEDTLLGELRKMIPLEQETAGAIRGFSWEFSNSKLDGIAWLEHSVLERPFLWLEDEYGVGDFELDFLAEHGWRASYVHCNVTRDPHALLRVHEELKRRWPTEVAARVA